MDALEQEKAALAARPSCCASKSSQRCNGREKVPTSMGPPASHPRQKQETGKERGQRAEEQKAVGEQTLVLRERDFIIPCACANHLFALSDTRLPPSSAVSVCGGLASFCFFPWGNCSIKSNLFPVCFASPIPFLRFLSAMFDLSLPLKCVCSRLVVFVCRFVFQEEKDAYEALLKEKEAIQISLGNEYEG